MEKKQHHVRNVVTGVNSDTIAKPYGYVTRLSLGGESILSSSAGGSSVQSVCLCT